MLETPKNLAMKKELMLIARVFRSDILNSHISYIMIKFSFDLVVNSSKRNNN